AGGIAMTDSDTRPPEARPSSAPTGALSPAKQALLAQRLRRGTAAAAAARRTIPARPDGQAPPPSAGQGALVVLGQVAPGTARFPIPVTVRLRGPLDATALAAALGALVAGHEALRMRYQPTWDGRPQVVIADDAPFPLTVAAAADEDAARALVQEFLAVPFDLAAGPVARALLVRLAAGDHVLAVGLHHI